MKPGNYFLTVSAVLNVVMAIAIFFLMRSCGQPCPQETIVKKYTDTVYLTAAQVKPSIVVKVPEAYHITKPKRVFPSLSLHLQNGGSVDVLSSGRSEPAAPSACDEVAIYTDTTEQENKYRAVILDTVSGNRITGRRITFWNLSPVITEHIEKTIALKESVRIYLGLSVGFEASYKEKRVSNFNVGPEVIITEPHGLLFGYGFDAKNNGHRLTFAYKIKLKK